MKDRKLVRVLPYIVVLAIAAYLYHAVLHFNFTATQGRLGPDAWPRLILILMMATCGYEIVRSLFFGSRERELEGVLESIIEETASKEQSPEAPPQQTYPHLLAAGIALTLAYVAMLDVLGFFVSTTLYLALFMLLGRYRRMGVILAISVLGSLVFVIVFMKIVYVSLPLGTGPFLTISTTLLKLVGIR